MSELTKLLEGVKVEWKNLGKVLKIKNGKGYKGYKPGNVPVYGSGGIMTYIDTYVCNKPSVLIPRKGSLKNLFYLNEPFWTVDTIFWTDIITEIVNPKFVFHCLKTRNLEDLNVAGGVPSLTQTVLNKILIPIPCPDNPEKSLKIQQDIVRILDRLSEETNQLNAALQKELDLHQKQYNFYREEMFKFEGKEVEWKSLGDILKRTKGTKITAEQMKKIHKANGQVKIFAGGKTVAFFNYEDIPIKDINHEPSIIVKSRGFIEFEYYDKPFSHKSEMWSYYSNNNYLNVKFIYYFLKIHESHFQILGKRMQMPQISIPDTDKFKIPVPCPNDQKKSLQEQLRIVNLLDDLDAKTKAITKAIQKEIALRNKQYEYYRDRLLSFQSLQTEVDAIQ